MKFKAKKKKKTDSTNYQNEVGEDFISTKKASRMYSKISHLLWNQQFRVNKKIGERREERGPIVQGRGEGRKTQIIKTSPFFFHFTIEKRKRFSSRPRIEQIETIALFLPFLTVKKKNNQLDFQRIFGLILNDTRQKKRKKTLFGQEKCGQTHLYSRLSNKRKK